MKKKIYLCELKPGTILQLVDDKTCKMLITDKLVTYEDYHPDTTWRVLVNINTGDMTEWAIGAYELPEWWTIYKLRGNNI